jgi:GntR family transcriptional regulator
MRAFFIDDTSPLPPYVQLKEQIKVAYASGQLRQGDVLPSVRALARELGTGEAAVRRAYKELCALNILSSERRKHVAVNHRLPSAPEAELLMGEVQARCDALIQWAMDQGLNALAVSRLLTRRAAERETTSPSYVYVDSGSSLAHRIARCIEQAWEVKVLGLSIEELGRAVESEGRRFTAILVNSYRYENLIARIDARGQRIFRLRIRQSPRIIRRIARLPVDSSVLIVHSDEDHRRIGRAVAGMFRELVQRDIRFETVPLSDAADLAQVAAQGTYQLVVVSVLVWDQLPERVRRMRSVVQSESEPDMQSLEEIRLPAGVLT